MRTILGEAAAPDEPAWYDVIAQFKAKAAQFTAAYNSLVSRQSEVPANMRADFNDLMERGQMIRQKIEEITGAIDSAWSWLKDKFGLSGYSEFRRTAQMAGLGIVPLIPIAIVVGAVALMTKFVTDAIQFNQRLDEVKRLESKGYTSAQAATIVQKSTTSPGLFSGLNLTPILLLVGVGGFLWYKKRSR